MTETFIPAFGDCGTGPESLLAYRDGIAWRTRNLADLERRVRTRTPEQSPHEERRLIAALVVRAERLTGEERAQLPARERRDDDTEALRLARDHGWDDGRLTAMRGLARSRGVPLERVLRAALRGGLRELVQMPRVDRRNPTEGEES